jgi:gluconate 5-dehydrogenase
MVAVAGHNAEKAKVCADAIGGYAAPFDALSVADTQRMTDEAARHLGRIDILVNCVGLNQEARAEEFDEERWDHVVDANLKSATFQSLAAARHMIAQGGGNQVHIGSVRTQLGLRGRGYAAYCAAKGGLAILGKQLAAEWAPHKINVTSLRRRSCARTSWRTCWRTRGSTARWWEEFRSEASSSPRTCAMRCCSSRREPRIS